MVYYGEKMVDREALCPINVMSYKFDINFNIDPIKTGQTSVLCHFFYFPNEQTSVLYLSILFLRPQCCKSRFFEDSTDN